jgi:hypothetical protein
VRVMEKKERGERTFDRLLYPFSFVLPAHVETDFKSPTPLPEAWYVVALVHSSRCGRRVDAQNRPRTSRLYARARRKRRKGR